MPRVSKKYLSKKVHEDLKENFSFLISSLHSTLDIEQFFEDFLSDEEKTMLNKRLMLYLMLENNYKSSEIKAVLGMSRETIRVHQNIWKKGGTGYKNVIKKIAKREQTKLFWEKVEKILKPLELTVTAKTNMKSRAKLLSGDYD